MSSARRGRACRSRRPARSSLRRCARCPDRPRSCPLPYGNVVRDADGRLRVLRLAQRVPDVEPLRVAEPLLQRREELRVAALVASARAEHRADERADRGDVVAVERRDETAGRLEVGVDPEQIRVDVLQELAPGGRLRCELCLLSRETLRSPRSARTCVQRARPRTRRSRERRARRSAQARGGAAGRGPGPRPSPSRRRTRCPHGSCRRRAARRTGRGRS